MSEGNKEDGPGRYGDRPQHPTVIHPNGMLGGDNGKFDGVQRSTGNSQKEKRKK